MWFSHESVSFNAAFIPPCAATLWLLTGWTLLTTAQLSPALEISTAALIPAHPAPITMQSCMTRKNLLNKKKGETSPPAFFVTPGASPGDFPLKFNIELFYCNLLVFGSGFFKQPLRPFKPDMQGIPVQFLKCGRDPR